MSANFRAALLKLVRGDGAGASRFAIAFWLVTSIAFAIAARANVGAAGVLTFGALMLPMLVFSVVGRTVGAKGLTARTKELAAMGAKRMSAAVAHVVVAIAASALLAGVTAMLFLAVAHTKNDPAIGSDLAATFVAALVSGAAYAAFFAFGSTFRAGAGRSLFLGLDWVLGGTGGLSLLLPRAHLRSLLGGANVLSLRPMMSLAFLVALAASFVGLAVLRAGRTRRS